MKLNGSVNELLRKYMTRETLMYLIFGAATTGVSLVSFYFFDLFKMHVAATNFASTLVAVLFAFFTNKLWVFNSKSFALKTFIPELLKFASGRTVMYFAETFLLVIMVSYGGINELLSKCVTTVFVVIANYLFSKMAVFKN